MASRYEIRPETRIVPSLDGTGDCWQLPMRFYDVVGDEGVIASPTSMEVAKKIADILDGQLPERAALIVQAFQEATLEEHYAKPPHERGMRAFLDGMAQDAAARRAAHRPNTDQRRKEVGREYSEGL